MTHCLIPFDYGATRHAGNDFPGVAEPERAAEEASTPAACRCSTRRSSRCRRRRTEQTS